MHYSQGNLDARNAATLEPAACDSPAYVVRARARSRQAGLASLKRS
jgi:hypothetical protein